MKLTKITQISDSLFDFSEPLSLISSLDNKKALEKEALELDIIGH